MVHETIGHCKGGMHADRQEGLTQFYNSLVLSITAKKLQKSVINVL